MTNLTIIEGSYTDVEREFIENEPPGLFPQDQSSVWGQVRSVYAAQLQTLADLLTKWYGNLDPRTVSDDDLSEWEYMLDLPSGNTALSPALRRAAIQSRFKRGPFTRTRRNEIIESFIIPTFGDATLLTGAGVPLTTSGVTLYSGVSSIAGTYLVVEDIPHFAYTVYVLSAVSVDTVGLTRELKRITPSGISFTISQVPRLPWAAMAISATATVTGHVSAKHLLGSPSILATSAVVGVVTKH
jgi:hypothetical protein